MIIIDCCFFFDLSPFSLKFFSFSLSIPLSLINFGCLAIVQSEFINHSQKKRPWDNDRVMNTDIDAVTNLLSEQIIWKAVKPFLEEFDRTEKIQLRPPSPTATVLGKTINQEFFVE